MLAANMEQTIGGRYKLGRKLGSGSFGEIHLGTDLRGGDEVAIKLEPVKSRAPQLLYEAKVYRVLAGGVGVPNVHWYGIEGEHNAMVIDLLGPSLEDLFNMCNRRFTLKTTMMLADQMISRLEYVHSRNIIHRDIKPDNFLIGIGSKAHKVHIIDFGLAKKYRDSKTHQHIPYKENKALTGTARYASVNTHLGVEQSRRDDLEAVGYLMVYFLKGQLPWQGLQARSKRDKYEQILRKKVDTTPEQLCRNLPSELTTYLHYCRSLRFEDRPDYSCLRALVMEPLAREGTRVDWVFDWARLPQKSTRPESAQSPVPQQGTAAPTAATPTATPAPSHLPQRGERTSTTLPITASSRRLLTEDRSIFDRTPQQLQSSPVSHQPMLTQSRHHQSSPAASPMASPLGSPQTVHSLYPRCAPFERKLQLGATRALPRPEVAKMCPVVIGGAPAGYIV